MLSLCKKKTVHESRIGKLRPPLYCILVPFCCGNKHHGAIVSKQHFILSQFQIEKAQGHGAGQASTFRLLPLEGRKMMIYMRESKKSKRQKSPTLPFWLCLLLCCVCAHVCGRACLHCLEVRGQPAPVISLLPPYGSS